MAAEAAKNQPKIDSPGDPSTEEILQSIRRILMDDEKPSDDKEELAPGSDVLELTEMVQDDGSVTEVKAEQSPAAPAAPPQDVLASIANALEKPEKEAAAPVAQKEEVSPAPPAPAAPVVAEAPKPEPIAKVDIAPPAPPPPAAVPEPMVEEEDDVLLSEEAAAASASALRKLTQPREKHAVHTPSPAFRSGATVEDLVLESLRPMLKEWLDGNLYNIVERIVEREVKRLSDHS